MLFDSEGFFSPSNTKVIKPVSPKKKVAKKAVVKKKAVKKKATKKKAAKRKTKAASVERKRIFWGVFSGSLKEEARFPWAQKEAAEEKLAALRAKSKKTYFMQPIKEPITAGDKADEEEE